MKSYKYPISHALTSFSGMTIQETPPPKPVATIHHLPTALRKKRDEEELRRLNAAIDRSRDFFLRAQLPSGYWWAELESNVTITAEYIMLFHLLGLANRDREKKMANYLLRQQTPEGYWTIYYGGPGDLSTTVEAYFALKLAGYSPDHPVMLKARSFILDRGGVIKCRVFTKIFLALFGEFDWRGIPSMPIELMLLPSWAYFNMYEFSSWSRATIIPLSIVMARRPVHPLPQEARVQELFVRPPQFSDYTFTGEDGIFTWKNFFIGIDHFLKVYEKNPVRPLLKKAMAVAEQWVLDHQEPSGDWGGIQPAMLNSVLALNTLGYGNDHPAVVKGLEALANFCIEDENTLVLQSCISPVWDTALALKALLTAGTRPDHPAAIKAAEWLLEREVRKPGDWKIKASELSPGGWAFEFLNDWYPDVDDSGFVMMAIKEVEIPNRGRKEEAIQRGLSWCLGMQSKNGGWGAFDRDNTKHLLNKIPFADLEALIDPPTADLTGRMLELMGNFAYSTSHPRAVRAIRFLKDNQEPEGPWWGRWGVNYIYGTWSVLSGLAAIGEDLCQPYIRKAVDWLTTVQNQDGGWGETCESYHDASLAGKGKSTPSQTAWALLALMASGEADSPAVARGIEFLLTNQKPDGTWDEQEFTGTGFPKYFMIKYHIYRNCFPLTALGTYRSLTVGRP